MAEMGWERINDSHDSVFRATAHGNLYPWEYTGQIRDWPASYASRCSIQTLRDGRVLLGEAGCIFERMRYL